MECYISVDDTCDRSLAELFILLISVDNHLAKVRQRPNVNVEGGREKAKKNLILREMLIAHAHAIAGHKNSRRTDAKFRNYD
jgi:hypothetical protein